MLAASFSRRPIELRIEFCSAWFAAGVITAAALDGEDVSACFPIVAVLPALAPDVKDGDSTKEGSVALCLLILERKRTTAIGSKMAAEAVAMATISGDSSTISGVSLKFDNSKILAASGNGRIFDAATNKITTTPVAKRICPVLAVLP